MTYLWIDLGRDSEFRYFMEIPITSNVFPENWWNRIYNIYKQELKTNKRDFICRRYY